MHRYHMIRVRAFTDFKEYSNTVIEEPPPTKHTKNHMYQCISPSFFCVVFVFVWFSKNSQIQWITSTFWIWNERNKKTKRPLIKWSSGRTPISIQIRGRNEQTNNNNKNNSQKCMWTPFIRYAGRAAANYFRHVKYQDTTDIFVVVVVRACVLWRCFDL